MPPRALGPAPTARGPSERALVECLWVLRRCEVAALGWFDVDLGRGMVSVRHGKVDKPGWTLLPPSTQAALHAWFTAAGAPADDKPVFPIPPQIGHPRFVGGPYTANGLGKFVRRILDRAGLWSPGSGAAHRFRRSFATTYIRANPGDLAGLQKLMRHTQLSTNRQAPVPRARGSRAAHGGAGAVRFLDRWPGDSEICYASV